MPRATVRPAPRIRLLLALLATGLGLGSQAGCLVVETGDPPGEPGACAASRTVFTDEVMPMLLDKSWPGAGTCRNGGGAGGCHDINTGRSAFRLVEVVNGDPLAIDQNYQRSLRFLNCASPEDSPLLTKPLAGRVNHGGGDIIPAGADQMSMELLLIKWAGR